MMVLKSATKPLGGHGTVVDELTNGDWEIRPLTPVSFGAWLTQFRAVQFVSGDDGEIIIHAIPDGGGATANHTGDL